MVIILGIRSGSPLFMDRNGVENGLAVVADTYYYGLENVEAFKGYRLFIHESGTLPDTFSPSAVVVEVCPVANLINNLRS